MIINIEKFISSLIERSSGITQQIFHSDLLNALKEQGLEYKDGEIVKTQKRIAAEAKEAIFDDDDEKIRKNLIEFLDSVWHLGRNADFDKWGKADCSDWIAWLEKQKDTNALIQEASEKAYTEGMRVERKHWLEKQDEQKPILDFKASNWYVSKVDGKIHDLTYNPTDKKELKKLTQSVTKISDKVWSEEDEKTYKTALSCIETLEDMSNGKNMHADVKDWLKSLKERLSKR